MQTNKPFSCSVVCVPLLVVQTDVPVARDPEPTELWPPTKAALQLLAHKRSCVQVAISKFLSRKFDLCFAVGIYMQINKKVIITYVVYKAE